MGVLTSKRGLWYALESGRLLTTNYLDRACLEVQMDAYQSALSPNPIFAFYRYAAFPR